MQRFQDTLQGYNNQLGQVKADNPWQISQEVDRLKEQALQQQLVKQKMESEDAFSKWLQGYYGGMGGGGGGRGGGGGGGGGAGGGGMGPSPGFVPTQTREGGPYGGTSPTQTREGGAGTVSYLDRVSSLRGRITGAEGIQGLPEWLQPYVTAYTTDPGTTYKGMADTTFGGRELTKQQQRLYGDPRVRRVLRRQFPGATKPLVPPQFPGYMSNY
jgi:hypothetical protein